MITKGAHYSEVFFKSPQCVLRAFRVFKIMLHLLEYNRESEERIHKGFALAQAQLTDLFS